MKKLTSFSWWSGLKVILKYSAYIIIIFEGIQSIMERIEAKDGVNSQNSDNA